MTTTVYTDGACLGNPGPGGWAWAVPSGPFAAGAETRTTNQRMEIRAVLEAARSLDGPLDIVSDSTYVVHCFRDRWWEGWLARGWKNSQKKDVANRDLWEPLIVLYRADPTRLRFRWVKGHSGDAMNDLVDRLAVEAARNQAPRAGADSPTGLGPPDAPAPARRQQPGSDVAEVRVRVPDGHRLVVTGHRPPGLGGYGDTLVAGTVRGKMVEILAAKRQLHPDLAVLTGLGLGAEQLGAEAAIEAGVPYVAVLPYPEQESVWPEDTRRRYRPLVRQAADVVVLRDRRPDSKQKAGAAIARRDAWLVRHAHEALVVWDGEDAWVGRTYRSLADAVGEENVWTLAP